MSCDNTGCWKAILAMCHHQCFRLACLYISLHDHMLLDVLSALGFSATIQQIIQFDRSAVVSKWMEDLPRDNMHTSQGGGFCQWVADNFDYNKATHTDNYNDTTNAMGIIRPTCQTPTGNDLCTEKTKRANVSVELVAKSGDFYDIIKPYKPPTRYLMTDFKIKPTCPDKILTANWHYVVLF